jgi:hypothetical protein
VSLEKRILYWCGNCLTMKKDCLSFYKVERVKNNLRSRSGAPIISMKNDL